MHATLFADEQVAAALRDARPADEAAVRRAQARAATALDAAFAWTRTVTPWER
ncbi:hypothetical protein [Mycobacteroides abscessus]|uniref:hypothetical protein n=1 Tax=Mycobacteroides abscessus TaxID=36809 RepID=UPI00092A3A75|nr:hypothetical protein [Mycobacteroides abscessus]MDM3921175.1 hypothetical protein [Mycobacteroides abscessus]MDO2964984.1 hypothetical protein [Mycobacteroides abscessus subsp. abscessus]MDO3260295.1 hypothetical protein [Mycobacteroides abscessus subsp. abscessus]MDO3309773.1 hypothetical protein [Mycobacteroides abscessus subsp. abscessus]SIG34791.1 Uncharacterised protein [Mycobacteroides abscessus subsp. abscessus]